MLTDRADGLNRRNWVILGVTVAIITACIYIFWKSDSIVEYLGQLKTLQKENDARRKELVTEREKLNAQVGNADFNLAAGEVKEKAVGVVRNYLNVVRAFTNDFKSDARYNDPLVVQNCKTRIRVVIEDEARLRNAKSVLEAIADPRADQITVDYAKEKLTVPQQLMKVMNQELANGGVRADILATQLVAIDALLRTVLGRLSADPIDEPAVRKDLAALEGLVVVHHGGVAKAHEVYEAEKRNQGNIAQVLRLSNIRQQLERVTADLTELDKKDAELQRSASQSVNSYGAWVPSLAVRVCCVILALFMTQFFMSIYRYNTMISSHYYSRADVLRMACTQGQLDPVNADTFAKLAACMTMEKIDFTLPDSVIDKIVAVAATRMK